MKKCKLAIIIGVGLLFVLAAYYCYNNHIQNQGNGSSGGGSGGVTVTYYFNPGCPHCRNFTPIWKEFVAQGGAVFKEINCAENPSQCQGVRGVPWVVFSKNGSQGTPYSGPRDKASLCAFLKQMS